MLDKGKLEICVVVVVVVMLLLVEIFAQVQGH